MRDTSPKRNEIQILNDRRRTAELLLKGYTHQEIRDIIEQETGVSLSRRTITNDVAAIRKDWQEQERDDYNALVNQEVARLDNSERHLWQAYLASCQDEINETIEQIARYLKEEDGSYSEEYQLKVQKVTQYIKRKQGVGDMKIFSMILDVQKERRKILGLYAPSRLGIDVTNKTEIIIKGYAVKDASPDAWPELGDGNVIEGELLEA